MKLAIIILFILILSFPIQISFGQNQTESQIKKWSSIGASLMQEGKFFEAIEYFDKILEIEPTDSIALGNKGAALTQLNRHEEALLIYDKALQVDPLDRIILNNKAATLFELGKTKEVLQTLDKILEIDPTDVNVLILKGKVLSESKRPAEAFSTFKKASEINPTNEDIRKMSSYEINQIMLIPITNSKYLGHVVLHLRNSQGILVSVTVSDALGYLPHEVTDEYLDASQVIEIVNVNDKKYEKRVFEYVTYATESSFIGRKLLGHNNLGYEIITFDVLPHGIIVEKGDTLTTNWTILRQID